MFSSHVEVSMAFVEQMTMAKVRIAKLKVIMIY